jgi:hypothetical protein
MKFIGTAAALAAAAFGAATPAAAYSVSIDQAVCPMDVLGEEGAEALSRELSAATGKPSDMQIERLTTATNSCAAKHGWSKEDSQSALDFNLAIISAIGLEEKLRASGVEASEFESVLDEQTPDALQAVVDGGTDNPIIDKAIEMLAVQQGDRVNAEMAGNLGAYLVHVARTQLLAMNMIDVGE